MFVCLFLRQSRYVASRVWSLMYRPLSRVILLLVDPVISGAPGSPRGTSVTANSSHLLEWLTKCPGSPEESLAYDPE